MDALLVQDGGDGDDHCYGVVTKRKTKQKKKENKNTHHRTSPQAQRAMRQYQAFYGLAPGTTSYYAVKKSSAGIAGWAAASWL